MSEIKSVEVGDKTYHITQASAVKQKTLMSIIGARLSMNMAALQQEEISQNLLTGLLLGLPEKELDRVSEILLYKTVEAGGDRLITIQDFQGKIHSYFILLAEALRLNLEDFFFWLENATKADSKTEQSQ